MTQEDFVKCLQEETKTATLFVKKDGKAIVILSNEFDYSKFKFSSIYTARMFLKQLHIESYCEKKER